jgi:membrane-anchored glycerophosphoryl diester phosphodiesterase (GDPDase)
MGFFFSTLAVRWHRFAWMQEGFGSLQSMTPTRRDCRFFGYYFILVGALILPPTLILAILPSLISPSALTYIIFPLCFIFIAWIGARMALALPIIALDAEYKILDSWKLSKGYAWKIFLALIMSMFPFSLASSIVSKISLRYAENNLILAASLDLAAVWLYVIAIGACASATT